MEPVDADETVKVYMTNREWDKLNKEFRRLYE